VWFVCVCVFVVSQRSILTSSIQRVVVVVVVVVFVGFVASSMVFVRFSFRESVESRESTADDANNEHTDKRKRKILEVHF
jgi:amino acid permease